MGGLERLPAGFIAASAACLISAVAAGSIGYGIGFRYAHALGAAELEKLRSTHAQQAQQVAEQNSLQLQQQVTRANQAEARMLEQQGQIADYQQQLQERIPHVTTRYLPAPDAAPVAIPRCVFTAGWLHDYNAALGVPSAETDTTAAGPAQAPGAAADAGAELLESGVTPADILAHAIAYGKWARGNLAQLNALLDLHEGN